MMLWHTGSYIALVASVMLMILLSFLAVLSCCFVLLTATAACCCCHHVHITTAVWLLELLQLCHYAYLA